MLELCTIYAANIFVKTYVCKNFCVAIILLEELSGKIILNLILASWKVICHSRKEQIAVFNYDNYFYF